MSDKLPPGHFWHRDGTLGVTDEHLRAALPAADFWPPDPRKGDLAQREDGSLWSWTGEHWWSPQRGYFCFWQRRKAARDAASL